METTTLKGAKIECFGQPSTDPDVSTCTDCLKSSWYSRWKFNFPFPQRGILIPWVLLTSLTSVAKFSIEQKRFDARSNHVEGTQPNKTQFTNARQPTACNQLFKRCSHRSVAPISHLLQSTLNTKDQTISSACLSWQYYLILRQPLTEVSVQNLVWILCENGQRTHIISSKLCYIYWKCVKSYIYKMVCSNSLLYEL